MKENIDFRKTALIPPVIEVSIYFYSEVHLLIQKKHDLHSFADILLTGRNEEPLTVLSLLYLQENWITSSWSRVTISAFCFAFIITSFV